MINLENISKSFKTPSGTLSALDNINITVERGEIFAVIGKSGAGKSTLIRCVNGLETPTSGTITIDTQTLNHNDAKSLRNIRLKIGMIFQHFNLLSHKTVEQNIALPLQFLKKPGDKIKQRVDDLLNLVGLSDKKNHYPAQLSGGQKQRVAIARALASEANILLCDEATSSLDPQTTHAILQLLKQINEELNITIMLITHDMNVVKQICHRVAILDQGKIIEMAETLRLFAHPQTQVAKELLRIRPELEIPKELIPLLSDKPTPGCAPLVRLCFLSGTVAKPIITRLIRDYQLDINILQANVEYIGNETIGTMLFEIRNPTEKLAGAIAFLEQQQIEVEELGYVTPRTATTV